MERRDFLTTLAAGVVTVPAALAQQQGGAQGRGAGAGGAAPQAGRQGGAPGGGRGGGPQGNLANPGRYRVIIGKLSGETFTQIGPAQTVVVVTHGGVLDMIYRTARSLGLSGPRQSDIPNAGLNRIRVRDGAIDILAWADTRHLGDLPPQPVYDQKKYAGAEPPQAGVRPLGSAAKP